MLTVIVETDYNADRKEARGSPLFSYLNGVQVVGGSNPLTPTLDETRRLKVWLYHKMAAVRSSSRVV